MVCKNHRSVFCFLLTRWMSILAWDVPHLCLILCHNLHNFIIAFQYITCKHCKTSKLKGKQDKKCFLNYHYKYLFKNPKTNNLNTKKTKFINFQMFSKVWSILHQSVGFFSSPLSLILILVWSTSKCFTNNWLFISLEFQDLFSPWVSSLKNKYLMQKPQSSSLKRLTPSQLTL